MSRGPGYWQRLVLGLVALAADGVVELRWRVEDALDRRLTAAEASAVNRAAWSLSDRGLATVWRGWVTRDGRRYVVLLVGGPDVPAERPWQARSGYTSRSKRGDGLSVEGCNGSRVPHLAGGRHA